MYLRYLNQDTKWLSYQARNGIICIQFYNEGDLDGDAKIRLKHFIDNIGISLSNANPPEQKRTYFRLLDTSMNDSVDILDSIINECSNLRNEKNTIDKDLRKIKILLADPESSFAHQRAKSIANANNEEVLNPLKKTQDALEAISRKLRQHINQKYLIKIESCSINEGNYKDSIKKLAAYINKHGKTCGLELKFYSEVPSGPMYFLRNILIQGRFCSGISAIKLPWMAIINDLRCENDLYDIFSNEFDKIWNNLAYELPEYDSNEAGISESSTNAQILEETEKLRQENERLKQEKKEQSQRIESLNLTINNNNISSSGANLMQETSSFNVGDNNQLNNVAGRDFKDNIIGNLPSTQDSQEPGIKEELGRLVDAVNADDTLDIYQKESALEQLKKIASAWEDPDEKSKKGRFNIAKSVLKAIFSALGPTANLIKIWTIAEPALNRIFNLEN